LGAVIALVSFDHDLAVSKDLRDDRLLLHDTPSTRPAVHHLRGRSPLPRTLGRLSALKELDLSSNCPTAIPESLGDLIALRRLNLGGNQLTSLPDTLANLGSLAELNMVGNPLTVAPAILIPLIRAAPFGETLSLDPRIRSGRQGRQQ